MYRLLIGLVFFLFSGQALALGAIADFTQSMQHQQGFFSVYHDPEAGKLYLRVDTLDTPFLFQSSLPRGVGSNDIGLDRGQLGQTRLVQFERAGNKLLLKQLNTAFRASTDNAAERRSIQQAFASSVIAGLPIVAKDNGGFLVDYSDFLMSDIHGIQARLQALKQGQYRVDAQRSGLYLPRTRAFVDNTELEAQVTFAGTQPGAMVKEVVPEPTSLTVHLHHSLIRLPDDGYQPRAFHPYSGFWHLDYLDYAAPIDGALKQQLIPRHRLVKRDPSARYSEAVEPIVYYLDPGIPEPVKSALRDGAMWWNRAFEKIGFVDAFQVRDLPVDADPMDVRYNVIQWVHRATRGWSYGGAVVDPRTGEIIKGHVTLGSLRVRQDYLIALGLTSPFSQDNADISAQQAMALARIRQLAAHEVGHTLGIAHNFAGSMNDRASVMDYPHPLVFLEGGEIRMDEAYDSGIGEWDAHVIAYGYQHYANAQNEAEGLATQLEKTREAGLLYVSDPDARPPGSPSVVGHLWDNGQAPVDELQRLLDLRRVALNRFGIDSLPQEQPLSQLQRTFVPLYLMHRYQVEAVVKLLGGLHYAYESKGDYAQPRGVLTVDSSTQIKALKGLIDTLSVDVLGIPERLNRLLLPMAYGDGRDREVFKGKTGLSFDPLSAAESMANHSLTLLLHPERLNRVAQQHDIDDTLPGIADIAGRLVSTTVKQGEASGSPLLYFRIAHLVLDKLVQTQSGEGYSAEVKSQIWLQLQHLRAWLKQQQNHPHYGLMAQHLNWYFNTGEWRGEVKPLPLPPGSPI